MCVRLNDGRIVRIAKDLTAATTDAESTGLFVLSGQARLRLLSACRLVHALAMLDAGRPLGAPHHRRRILALSGLTRLRGGTRSAMGSEGDFGVLAAQRNPVDLQHSLHLRGHGVHDALDEVPSATSVATRLSAACCSAKRSTSARVGVANGRCHKFSELGK